MTAATVSRETETARGLGLTLPIESIDSSPLNPRQHFDQAHLDELAASLQADGLLQPIVVKRTVETGGGVLGGDRYEIVAGERRWRAAKQLGWSEIQVLIRNDIDEATHVRLALLENLARTDLNPLEEARGYQQLLDLGMTQEQVAAAVHRSRPAVANALRLLKAPESVQQKLREGALQPSHVLPLLKYEAFPEVVLKIAEIAEQRRTPSKELEKELGWEFTVALREAKLAVDISSAVFDWQRVCKTKCPFGAFAQGQYGGQCLKPEHFRELQKEQRARDKAKLEKTLAKSAAPDGTAALKLTQLKYGQYEQIYTAPSGCSAACECRRSALSYGDQVVQVCIKPAEYRGKQQAERDREAAERREKVADLAKRCNERLAAIDAIGSPELALLAVDALGQVRDAKQLDAILAKHAPGLKPRGKREVGDLATLEPLQLVKIAVEALIGEELAEASQYPGERTAYASWYAGPAPKAEKPKATRKGKPKPEHAVAAP